jgi:hypothetical protein
MRSSTLAFQWPKKISGSKGRLKRSAAKSNNDTIQRPDAGSLTRLGQGVYFRGGGRVEMVVAIASFEFKPQPSPIRLAEDEVPLSSNLFFFFFFFSMALGRY